MRVFLTQLLEMVLSGQLDNKHSGDILKLLKREMFGDSTFDLTEQFLSSGSL